MVKIFKELVPRIYIQDVKDACKRDFYKEWLLKTDKDTDSLNDSHIQSYVVINLCRILYTISQNKIGSKTISSEWVKSNQFPEYEGLITKAQEWKYGDEMNEKDNTIEFILATKKFIEQ